MKIESTVLNAQKRITAALFVSQSLFSAAIIAAYVLFLILLHIWQAMIIIQGISEIVHKRIQAQSSTLQK